MSCDLCPLNQLAAASADSGYSCVWDIRSGNQIRKIKGKSIILHKSIIVLILMPILNISGLINQCQRTSDTCIYIYISYKLI